MIHGLNKNTKYYVMIHIDVKFSHENFFVMSQSRLFRPDLIPELCPFDSLGTLNHQNYIGILYHLMTISILTIYRAPVPSFTDRPTKWLEWLVSKIKFIVFNKHVFLKAFKFNLTTLSSESIILHPFNPSAEW